jgi:6-pyruvoyl-tetrahydropterin synthase
MESFVRARSYIHGKHTLKNHPVCGRECGHFWEIEVIVTGDEEQERHQMPVDEVKLLAELKSISEELSGKDIDKMIKPATSSPIGIAHWYHERLASRYDVREVVVWRDPDLSAILRAP